MIPSAVVGGNFDVVANSRSGSAIDPIDKFGSSFANISSLVSIFGSGSGSVYDSSCGSSSGYGCGRGSDCDCGYGFFIHGYMKVINF